MPTAGIAFDDEQWEKISEYQRQGLGPIELTDDDSVPNRSEVVRALVMLGIGAVEGWKGADWEMSVQNAQHETRMATLDAKRESMSKNRD